jgi:hypothetical protein
VDQEVNMVNCIPLTRLIRDNKASLTTQERFGQSLENNIKNSVSTLTDRCHREVPEFGQFQPVEVAFDASQSFPAIGTVTYRVGHWENPDQKHDQQNMRYLDFNAKTPGKRSSTDQYLFVGTKQELMTYLRNKEQVLKDTKGYLDSTERAFTEFNAG